MGHEAVLLEEALVCLAVRPQGVYLDCTGGMGGHAAALLARLSPTGKLWICDYHRETAEGLKERFHHDERVMVAHSRFSRIFDNLVFPFDGIIADLGISSPQLEDSQLGIGFSLDEVFLDMRIDKALTETAADILKNFSEQDLANIFFYQGGETGSRKIARAIVEDRRKGIFYTQTGTLRDLCARVLGRYYRGRKIHAATKVFQALRVVVNREQEELAALLARAPGALCEGGRLVVIAFHAGEDRLVKERFRGLAREGAFSLPVKKVIKPGRDEILKNPRARSAKMRVLQSNGQKGGE